MIRFVLMVNRQGQTRLSRYYHPVELGRRAQLEADVVRCCLGRTKEQVTRWGLGLGGGGVVSVSPKVLGKTGESFWNLGNSQRSNRSQVLAAVVDVGGVKLVGGRRRSSAARPMKAPLLLLPVFLCGVQRLQAGLPSVCRPLHRGWRQ